MAHCTLWRRSRRNADLPYRVSWIGASHLRGSDIISCSRSAKTITISRFITHQRRSSCAKMQSLCQDNYHIEVFNLRQCRTSCARTAVALPRLAVAPLRYCHFEVYKSPTSNLVCKDCSRSAKTLPFDKSLAEQLHTRLDLGGG